MFWAVVEMLILMSWGCDGGSPLHFGPAPRGAGAFADHNEPPGRTECFSGCSSPALHRSGALQSAPTLGVTIVPQASEGDTEGTLYWEELLC